MHARPRVGSLTRVAAWGGVTGDLPALASGDRVALLVPGSARYVAVVVGLLARGIVPVPMDPRLTPHERERILAGLDPALVATTDEDVAALAAAYAPADASRVLPLARPMHVTSGTTGVPKGVWSGVLEPEAATALVEEERDLWGFRADDVNLVVSPLYHSAPLRFAMGTVLAGGRVAGFADDGSQPGFDVEHLTRVIERERPTTMFCVPAHLQRLFAHWDEAGWPDLGCFLLVAHAGAPCPPAVKHRLIEAFPDGSTWEFYGSTEGQFTACPSAEWLERPGTVGRARAGRRVSLDARGQVWSVVPEHARFSYFGDPEKTAAAWTDTPEGPAFTVGDLGRLDEDGYLWLDGRREDLIISGGVNVYPTEVEHVLAEHPGVEDIAVYGVADDRWGQRVCAAVVGSVRAEDLARFARERLSPPKRPKQYQFLPELPCTLTGKVRRTELADPPT